MIRDRRIGLRDARARLGRLIEDLEPGVDWLITDHGRPVARLTAVTPDALDPGEKIAELERAGLLEPPPKTPLRLPAPLPIEEGLLQRYLQEDRGD